MVVVQKVEEVTACCKVFLSKSQELQVTLNILLPRIMISFSSADKWQEFLSPVQVHLLSAQKVLVNNYITGTCACGCLYSLFKTTSTHTY